MLVTFTVQVVYHVSCSACNSCKRVTQYTVPGGCEFPHPTLPDGWRVLDGQPICDRHKIKVGKAMKVWEKGA